ncbi:MAG: ABC transporter permease [Bryobacterales bacterium]|nr:ABC transporter permease [Bryobacterales bacterium]
MNSIASALLSDIRLAFRVIARSPAFSAVAILSLGLGIGANTAVFSVVNSVLLRPLPYANPDQLVRISDKTTQDALSVGALEFLRQHAESYSAVAGYRGPSERRFSAGAEQEWINVLPVTGGFLQTIGIQPAIGRDFNRDESITGGPRSIILTDSLWRSAFGADPTAVGRTITLNETAKYLVIGVLPASYWFPHPADALIALRPTGGVDDAGANTQLIARLRPSRQLREAQTELVNLGANFRRTPHAHSKFEGFTAGGFHQSLVADLQVKILLIFGATVLLLLIACCNLAGLLLTRFAARGKELAIRLAVGGGLARLLGQFLVENMVLVSIGAATGLAGAFWLLKLMLAMMPFRLPASGPLRIDGAVLGFTVLTVLFTSLLLTLVALYAILRLNILAALQAGGRGNAASVRQRTRSLLVVGEVAMAASLLITAALLVQSLFLLQRQRLGFEPHGLTTFQTPIAKGQDRTAGRMAAFATALSERLKTLPGVRAVAAANVLPLTGPNNLPAQRDGFPEHSFGGVEIRLVTGSYFEAMGIAVQGGRVFGSGDRAAGAPVAVINETLAKRWWPGGEPVGGRLVIGRLHGKDFPEIKDAAREVIGVAADTKVLSLKEAPRPTIYIPLGQAPDVFTGMSDGLSWVVSSARTPALAEVRAAVREHNPSQTLRRFRSMEDLVAATTADSRLDAWLVGLFAAVAFALSIAGVYGLVSFSVSQRHNEIGTRMALGAARTDIVRLILSHGVALTMTGLAIGATAALLLTGSLSKLLYGVKPRDPLSFAAAAVLLLCAGAAASYVPARKASRIDPMLLLRGE